MDDGLCLRVVREEQPEPPSNLGPSSVVRWAYLGRVAQLSGLRLDFVVKFYYRVNFREKSISSSGDGLDFDVYFSHE